MCGEAAMLGRIFLFFKMDRFAADASRLVIASILGQGIAIAAMPLITRLYSSHDFGVYSIYSSMLGIFSSLACFRYERAIPLPKDDVIATYVFLLAFALGTLFSLCLFLLIPIFGHLFVSWLKFPGFYPYLWLLPVGVWGASVYTVLSFWAVRQQRFKRLASTKIAQGFGQVFAQLGFAFLPFAALGLLLGQVVGHTAGSGGLAVDIYRRDGHLFSSVTISRLLGVLKRYSRFIYFSTPATVLNSIAFYVPAVLLTVQHGVAVAGYYGLASQAVRMPLSLIEASVGKVYLGNAAKLIHEDPSKLLKFYLSTIFKLFLIGVVPAAALLFFGPALFSRIFGVHWHQAGIYARILSVMFLVEFSIVAPSQNLTLLEMQHTFLIWNAVFAGLVFLAFLPSHFLTLSPSVTLLLLGLGMIVSYFLFVLLNIYGITRFAKQS
jgi:O-antigen/teichoic acid export membrane protein